MTPKKIMKIFLKSSEKLRGEWGGEEEMERNKEYTRKESGSLNWVENRTCYLVIFPMK